MSDKWNEVDVPASACKQWDRSREQVIKTVGGEVPSMVAFMERVKKYEDGTSFATPLPEIILRMDMLTPEDAAKAATIKQLLTELIGSALARRDAEQ
jgi:hypothetical protein